jgi:hypothetical protein
MSSKEIIEKYMGFLRGKIIPYENYNDMLHFIPQSVFYNFFDIKFDFVGTVENIVAGIEEINYALGVNEVITRENRSEASVEFIELLDRYIEENKEFVDEFLKEDLLLYNSIVYN